MNHSSRERQPLHTHAAFTKPHKLPTANLAQKAMQLVSKGSSNSFLLAENKYYGFSLTFPALLLRSER
jgi:hypothetical protein